MQPAVTNHVNDEVVERYSMGRLNEPELGDFESHLLMCAYCQEALTSTETYLASMRSAARELRGQIRRERRWHQKVLMMPAPAWIAAAAAVAAFFVVGDSWRPLSRSAEPLPAVMLEADRGTDLPGRSRTQALKPFVLMLDLTDLEQLPRYSLEVVDTHGRQVFQTDSAPSKNAIRATVTEGFPAGFYYVRLYDGSHGLLREYGLNVAD